MAEVTESQMIGVHRLISVPIDLIAPGYGPGMPARFLICYKCGRPALELECGQTNDARFRNVVYREESSNSFAAWVREGLGTVIEVPVCKLHRTPRVMEE